MLEPQPIRAGKVAFLDSQAFDFDSSAKRVLIFHHPLHLDDELIAWQPRTGELASWRGVAFALGENAIWNPASWFAGDALKVHRTPLDWLRANREGIVVVRPRLCYAMLHHVPRIACDDLKHAEQLKRLCRPPKPCTRFLVSSEEAEAA
jgi:hypothetical protein